MLRYLADHGVPIRLDRAAAWEQYQHLRGRYQPALEFLAELTLAPETRPIDQT